MGDKPGRADLGRDASVLLGVVVGDGDDFAVEKADNGPGPERERGWLSPTLFISSGWYIEFLTEFFAFI